MAVDDELDDEPDVVDDGVEELDVVDEVDVLEVVSDEVPTKGIAIY